MSQKFISNKVVYRILISILGLVLCQQQFGNASLLKVEGTYGLCRIAHVILKQERGNGWVCHKNMTITSSNQINRSECQWIGVQCDESKPEIYMINTDHFPMSGQYLKEIVGVKSVNINSSIEPTGQPSQQPSVSSSTSRLSYSPTIEPTSQPSTELTMHPSPEPTMSPTSEPTSEPSWEPTGVPTIAPTAKPTFRDSVSFEIIQKLTGLTTDDFTWEIQNIYITSLSSVLNVDPNWIDIISYSLIVHSREVAIVDVPSSSNTTTNNNTTTATSLVVQSVIQYPKDLAPPSSTNINLQLNGSVSTGNTDNTTVNSNNNSTAASSGPPVLFSQILQQNLVNSTISQSDPALLARLSSVLVTVSNVIQLSSQPTSPPTLQPTIWFNGLLHDIPTSGIDQTTLIIILCAVLAFAAACISIGGVYCYQYCTRKKTAEISVWDDPEASNIDYIMGVPPPPPLHSLREWSISPSAPKITPAFRKSHSRKVSADDQQPPLRSIHIYNFDEAVEAPPSPPSSR